MKQNEELARQIFLKLSNEFLGKLSKHDIEELPLIIKTYSDSFGIVKLNKATDVMIGKLRGQTYVELSEIKQNLNTILKHSGKVNDPNIILRKSPQPKQEIGFKRKSAIDCPLFDYIYKDAGLYDTSSICFYDDDPKILLESQLECFSTPELHWITAYLTADFKEPLVIQDSVDPFRCLNVLMMIRQRLLNLTDKITISPHEKNFTLCRYGIWDSSFVYEPKNQDLQNFIYNDYTTNGNRLGLFILHGYKRESNIDDEFKKLLQHYIWNHKCIIAVDLTFRVDTTKSWLARMLKNRSITVDIAYDRLNQPIIDNSSLYSN